MSRPVVRARLITNPRSGRGGIDLTEPLGVLRAHGWDVEVREKRHGGDATELARSAVHAGRNVIVNCGGDGTLSEIVDGVIGTDVAVGTLPGGTANLWAKEVGISPRLRIAALQLVGAERRHVDVGRVSINKRHRRNFILMAGLGFDGVVMEHVSKPLKNRIGPLAIGLAAARAIPGFQALPVRIELDGIHWEGYVSQIVVGNTRRYAGFTHMTPDAFVDDGQLDVCLITSTTLAGAGLQLGSLLMRQRPSAVSAEFYRASSITIHAPSPIAVEVDGGSMPVPNHESSSGGSVYHFSVLAQGMTMLLPRTYSGPLFQRDPLGDAILRTPAFPNDSAHHERSNGHGEAHDRDNDRADRRLMKIIAVGADDLTAMRVHDGHVITVALDAHTTIADGDGERIPISRALATLTEGDMVRIKGKRDHGRGIVWARRIKRIQSGP